jgi:hypothetical protein
VTTTASHLTRWAGLAAVAGGGLFVAIQWIHPADVPSSVTTGAWAIVHYLGFAMGVLNLLGVMGIHARQADKAGWLGVAGAVLVGSFWAITAAFQFAEAIVLPAAAADAPGFVASWVGMVSGEGWETDLGAIPVIYTLAGFIGYLLGGLALGVATLRAGVLPRGAAGLLAGGAIAGPVLTALLPHALERSAALPMGLALAWLGYALWSERPEAAAAARPVAVSPRLSQVGAE